MDGSITMFVLGLVSFALSFRAYMDEQVGWAALFLGVGVVDCILSFNT